MESISKIEVGHGTELSRSGSFWKVAWGQGLITKQ